MMPSAMMEMYGDKSSAEFAEIQAYFHLRRELEEKQQREQTPGLK